MWLSERYKLKKPKISIRKAHLRLRRECAFSFDFLAIKLYRAIIKLENNVYVIWDFRGIIRI